jgi:hypothetical protein
MFSLEAGTAAACRQKKKKTIYTTGLQRCLGFLATVMATKAVTHNQHRREVDSR